MMTGGNVPSRFPAGSIVLKAVDAERLGKIRVANMNAGPIIPGTWSRIVVHLDQRIPVYARIKQYRTNFIIGAGASCFTVTILLITALEDAFDLLGTIIALIEDDIVRIIG